MSFKVRVRAPAAHPFGELHACVCESLEKVEKEAEAVKKEVEAVKSLPEGSARWNELPGLQAQLGGLRSSMSVASRCDTALDDPLVLHDSSPCAL